MSNCYTRQLKLMLFYKSIPYYCSLYDNADVNEGARSDQSTRPHQHASFSGHPITPTVLPPPVDDQPQLTAGKAVGCGFFRAKFL